MLTEGDLINTFWGSNGLDFDIVNRVTSWHDMADVNVLNKSLDTGTAKDGVLAHGLGDLTWGTFKACDEDVAERALLVLVKGGDTNSLLTCITAS